MTPRTLATLARLFASTLTLAALASCSKPAEPEPSPASASPGSTSASSSGAAPSVPGTRPSEIAWTAPASWQSAPNPSAMRKATYRIPKTGDDPEDADLSVSQAGGGVDANIKRWQSQFDGSPELKVTHRDVGALSVAVVEGHGTFTGAGMPGSAPAAPKRHWALLGAIVESAEPPYFFKLTGPEKTVAAARPDFDAFVASFHAAK